MEERKYFVKEEEEEAGEKHEKVHEKGKSLEM